MVEADLILQRTQSLVQEKKTAGFESYFRKKIQELETKIAEKQHNMRRLVAQRAEINERVRALG